MFLEATQPNVLSLHNISLNSLTCLLCDKPNAGPK